MQTQTSFVRSDRTVELYTVSGIYPNLSLVIYPRHAELKLTFRLNQTLQKSFFSVLFFVLVNYRTQRLQNLSYCLMEFRFCRVFLDH